MIASEQSLALDLELWISFGFGIFNFQRSEQYALGCGFAALRGLRDQRAKKVV
jgi:hypothetical protein